MKKIALIGECMIELNGSPFAEMWQTYGGDSLNTATYLARVSSRDEVDVQYISALGMDNLSNGMLARWQQEGINTTAVLRDEKRQPGLYLIQLDEQGERTFLYWRNQSAARYLLQHSDYPLALAQLEQADMVYLSGISLAILPEQDRLTLIQQLEQLSKKGIQIIFDSNYRPALWDCSEQTREIYSALYPLIDVALVTFDDEQALWQDQNAEASIKRLKSQGVKTVVVKQGKQGAIFETCSSEGGNVPTQPIHNVVDSTSAGDAFNAGFLAGYLQGKDMYSCCQQGNQLAGIVIQHKGAIIPAAAMQNLHF